MATAKQIAANRRNAQNSTGPKTPEGKATVSQNRTVHGLCGRFYVVPGIESQEQFDTLLQQFLDENKPKGHTQRELVVKMAQATWLSHRAVRTQNECFILQPRTPEQIKNGDIPVRIDNELEHFTRYQAAHDRAYQRAAAELARLKKEERLAEIGFERQKRAEADEIRKAEKHAVAQAIAKLRKQRAEMKLGCEIGDALRETGDPALIEAALAAFGAAPTPSTGKILTRT
ncbi:MAG: hypothetical protein JO091_05620 [Acidobacteriaceae bacterium]|nr:hypothetical protein [Acidobacteriaceae bacterium]